MRKANTEHLDMHCHISAEPHSSTHTQTCRGKAALSATRALCSKCPGKAAQQGERGVWGTARVLDSFFFLSSAENSAVGTGARSIMSLEFLTYLSQASLQRIRTQNTFRMKNAVKSCLPYRFVKPGRQVEYNTTSICAFLFAVFRIPQSSFSKLFAYTTVLTVVVSPTRIKGTCFTNAGKTGKLSAFQDQMPCIFSVDCLF